MAKPINNADYDLYDRTRDGRNRNKAYKRAASKAARRDARRALR